MLNIEDTNDLAASRGIWFETILDSLMDVKRAMQDYGLILSVATSMRCTAPLPDLIA
jgi:hypothetical protein